jgi:hypothetical protein
MNCSQTCKLCKVAHDEVAITVMSDGELTMAAKKTPASKASVSKASVSKTVVKAAVKKTAVKASKKAASKKAVLKKTVVKKGAATKASTKKGAAKKTGAKAGLAKTLSVKKPVNKVSSKKSSPKKSSAKKSVSSQPTAKQVAIKKPPSRKTAAAARAVQKKSASKKTSAKKSLPAKTIAVKAGAKAPVRKAATKTALPKAPPKALVETSVAIKPTRRLPNVRRRDTQTVVKIIPLEKKRATLSPVKPQKTAKTVAKPMTGTRGSPRSPTVSKRSARSPARGLAPLPLASVPASEGKPRGRSDQPLSEQKLAEHIRTSLCYLETWLHSGGADVTPAMSGPAEAARAQIWRWLDCEAAFEDGRQIDIGLLEEFLNHELASLRGEIGTDPYDASLYVTAAELFLNLVSAPDFNDFPGIANAEESLPQKSS